jgi:hypothetical protein
VCGMDGATSFSSASSTVSEPRPLLKQLNGTCANSGRAVLRNVSIVVRDAGDGARISYIANIDPIEGPSTSERTRLDFKPCLEGGSRCAFLQKFTPSR